MSAKDAARKEFRKERSTEKKFEEKICCSRSCDQGLSPCGRGGVLVCEHRFVGIVHSDYRIQNSYSTGITIGMTD